MSNVLEELWYGNIAPSEQNSSDSTDAKELFALIVRHRDDLDSSITDKQKETLEKLMDASFELHGKLEKQAFLIGFKLGMKIAVEGLTNE